MNGISVIVNGCCRRAYFSLCARHVLTLAVMHEWNWTVAADGVSSIIFRFISFLHSCWLLWFKFSRREEFAYRKSKTMLNTWCVSTYQPLSDSLNRLPHFLKHALSVDHDGVCRHNKKQQKGEKTNENENNFHEKMRRFWFVLLLLLTNCCYLELCP